MNPRVLTMCNSAVFEDQPHSWKTSTEERNLPLRHCKTFRALEGHTGQQFSGSASYVSFCFNQPCGLSGEENLSNDGLTLMERGRSTSTYTPHPR